MAINHDVSSPKVAHVMAVSTSACDPLLMTPETVQRPSAPVDRVVVVVQCAHRKLTSLENPSTVDTWVTHQQQASPVDLLLHLTNGHLPIIAC